MLAFQLRNVLVLLLLTLLCAAAAIIHLRPAHSNPVIAPSNNSSSCSVTAQITQSLLVPKGARTFGNPKAPTTIVAFMDLQCRACADASPIVKDIVAQGNGRINLVVHHVQIRQDHTLTPVLTRIAEAAGSQGKYWQMYDLLFKNQASITAAKADDEAYRTVRGSAASLKLNLEQLDIDEAKKEFDKALTTGNKLSEDIALSGTPTFYVVNAKGRISRYNTVATLQNWASGKAQNE